MQEYTRAGPLLVRGFRGFQQLALNLINQSREQRGFFPAFGEQIAQQTLPAKITHRPEIRRDLVGLARADLGHDRPTRVFRGRDIELDRIKRLGRQVHLGVEGFVFETEGVAGLVQEQQVFAFDIEDNRVGVFRVRQLPAVQQTVQQKGGIGRLGGNAGHAADIHMRALAAVQKIEVAVHNFLAGQGQANRKLALHGVHEQGLGKFLIRDRAHRVARHGRIIILGHQAGHFDVGGNRQFNRQAAFGLHHVGVKRRALMAGADDIDHAE